MGARQSKRSVDITTTPKKEGLPVEGVVGDAAAPGDGKLEKIEETDGKPTTNGTAPHTEVTPEDKEKDKDEATEKEKEQPAEEQKEETKAEEAKAELSETPESPAEGATEVTTPSEGTPASPTTATSPDSKETKKKDKLKKKWSFRSISFSRKDKSKPAREDTPKNGDVTKEEALPEGGEEAEIANSPAEDKSGVSSPTDEKEQISTVAEKAAATAEVAAVAAVLIVEAKEVKDKTTAAKATVAAVVAVTTPATPVDDKKEDSTPHAPTPLPAEAKKIEEMVKQVEPANADNNHEVSPVQAVIEAPVEVNGSQSKQIATAPSIIERKTSEDFPSQFPSSPPPTPIEPSPLQQAQQVAANASAIAEALKLPAEAADNADKNNYITNSSDETQSSVPVSSTITHAILTTAQSSESSVLTGNSSFPKIDKPTDTIETPSPIIDDKSVLGVEIDTASERVADIVTKTEQLVEAVTSRIVETIQNETIESLENDLVIQTEEGPMPVSGDIFVVEKSASVVTDSPVVDGNASNESSDQEISDNDVPPPLPESVEPVPVTNSQLRNFLSTQVEADAEIVHVASRIITESNEIIEDIEELSDTSTPRSEEKYIIKIDEIPDEILPVDKKLVGDIEIEEEDDNNDLIDPAIDFTTTTTMTIKTDIETSLRSPVTVGDRCSDIEIAPELVLLDDQSNREFKVESVEESLNSYNDSELELKDRLTETLEDNAPVNCQLSYAVQENDQKKMEPEAPVENNIVANDIDTTQINDEAPKSAPPAIPAEGPILGPAITEDVASVTKAIEEIDINEKAVAAAVNENIESTNTNEIIADMNHQNNMTE